MDRIANFVGQPLEWSRASLLKPHYELKSGETLVATLRFRSVWGTFATGQSEEGSWTFKRVGFWQTRATIRSSDAEEEIAMFRNNTWSGGGTLLFPNGRCYQANTNFWQTQYEFKTEAGEPLIHYRNHGILTSSADVTILPEARDLAELPWMVMLGWYLILMMQSDSATTAAAAS